MDSTQRFSSRVESYVKYRPGYPGALLDCLEKQCGLRREHVIADVGSGTGISSELFLRRGHVVHGVEPNREMREAGERLLRAYPLFDSVDGTAERTTLPDGSVDFMVAGQAFHWFRHAEARVEFQRVLRPSGWVVLFWNARRTTSTPFLAAYERLLREYSTDYAQVNHVDVPAETIRAFFAPGTYQFATFDNEQRFDLEGVRGRLLSSSYAPDAGHPRHEPMLRELGWIFDAHRNTDAEVVFEYDTELHFGRVG